jgi:subtilisin family serine protease
LEPVFGGIHAESHRAALRRGLGTQGTLPEIDQVYLVRVAKETNLVRLATKFRRQPDVLYAEPNYLYGIDSVEAMDSSAGASTVGDPYFGPSGAWGQDFEDLWGLFRIEAPAAWESTEGEDVVVAVVDTGLDTEHPDLVANVWHNKAEIPDNGVDDDGNGYIDDIDGWDFTSCAAFRDEECQRPKRTGPDVHDAAGHGTHVAGIIAAERDNGVGIVGVAPHSQIMAVKGLNQDGDGNSRDLAEAVVYAAENGATVINASWSGPPSETLRLAIDYATSLGAIVVAAAGNSNQPLERQLYPASLPMVVTVGAETPSGERAPFSNFGGALDLVAPGGGGNEPATAVDPGRSILSLLGRDSSVGMECSTNCCPDDSDECLPEPCPTVCVKAPWVIDDDYVRAAGTSSAAPFVSGVAALVRSLHPSFSSAQVRQVLLGTAEDLGAAGWDRFFGYGRVNARRAVEVENTSIAQISFPPNDSKLSEYEFPITVRGTAQAPSSTLRQWELRLASDSADIDVARGSQPLSDGVLGVVDLTMHSLEPGRTYRLTLMVEDTYGHRASTSADFLIPAPRFATVPLPDPYSEGGFDGTISSDGERMALTRFHRQTNENEVWLFDLQNRSTQQFPYSAQPRLSGDGNTLLTKSRRCPFPDSPFNCGSVYHVDAGTTDYIRDLGAQEVLLNTDGSEAIFTSTLNLDPNGGNADGSTELFATDLLSENARQLTEGQPDSSGRAEITEITITPDACQIAFVGFVDLDPGAGTNPFGPRIFRYDNSTGIINQITGRSPNLLPPGTRPTITGDGRFITYETHVTDTGDSAVVRVDTLTGSLTHLFGESVISTQPATSSDGSLVAFFDTADLDPAVRNEDQTPELFLLDLGTGRIDQVTDRTSIFAPEPVRMASNASTFLMHGFGAFNRLPLKAGSVRVVPARRPNARPTLVNPPDSLVAVEGRQSEYRFAATDPDGDPLTFYVDLKDGVAPGLYDFNNAVLVDDGAGQATLTLTPDYTEAGVYTLLVALFDDAGATAIHPIQLAILDVPLPGDTNCDGRYGPDDVAAVIHAIFGRLPDACSTSDTLDPNLDSRWSAPDLSAIAAAQVRPLQP